MNETSCQGVSLCLLPLGDLIGPAPSNIPLQTLILWDQSNSDVLISAVQCSAVQCSAVQCSVLPVILGVATVTQASLLPGSRSQEKSAAVTTQYHDIRPHFSRYNSISGPMSADTSGGEICNS